MPLDTAALRAETPGAAEAVHLNAAGASLPTRTTLETVIGHLRREATTGGYEAADAVAADLAGFYDLVGRLVGARRDEVAFVESATVGWNRAFVALADGLGPGDVVLTSVAEYASNVLALLQLCRRTGASLEVADDDGHGQLDVDALAERLGRPDGERVRLVSVSHVPTQSGLVQPAEAIGRVARAAGVAYLLDACQSLGQVPLDLEALGCDALTATGRKLLRGPRGTGLLVVRRDRLADLEPYPLDLLGATWTAGGDYEVRDDARRFETWERSVAGQLGLAAAVSQLLDLGVGRVADHLAELAAGLRQRLAAIDGVTPRDPGERRCGIVTFTVEGRTAAEVVDALDDAGVRVRASSSASARFDLDGRGLDAVVRASPHVYNDAGDLDRFVTAVAEQAARSRT